MAGRPVKPRFNPNKMKVLEQLQADLANFNATTARELAEKMLGRPVTENERRALVTKT